MEKCDYFKDLILTDYIDGELDKNSAGNLESHLLDCSDCRVFLKEVKDNAALPFQQALHQPAPARLWDTIKQSIEHENQAKSPLADRIAQLKGWVFAPRMVPVFASLILMFLAGDVALNTIQIQQAREKDQGEYLVALLSLRDSSVPSENNDWGTPLEHYFL
jgi:anti-sigma factor RsiW